MVLLVVVVLIFVLKWAEWVPHQDVVWAYLLGCPSRICKMLQRLFWHWFVRLLWWYCFISSAMCRAAICTYNIRDSAALLFAKWGRDIALISYQMKSSFLSILLLCANKCLWCMRLFDNIQFKNFQKRSPFCQRLARQPAESMRSHKSHFFKVYILLFRQKSRSILGRGCKTGYAPDILLMKGYLRYWIHRIDL